ncbi:hypothetical protein MG293_001525 [Ovis ammon polii]|uniref:Prokineticin domain-containing protein n=1 Tax=Ovis ammon polii TaxID=230172 RepID=A0AAD4URD2_OVIAM|nr:hypothetical protein MG293_001525 [Ovis ammon polii]
MHSLSSLQRNGLMVELKACERDPQCRVGTCCAVSLWLRGLRVCTPLGRAGEECHPGSHKVPFFRKRQHHACPCLPNLLCSRGLDGRKLEWASPLHFPITHNVLSCVCGGPGPQPQCSHERTQQFCDVLGRHSQGSGHLMQNRGKEKPALTLFVLGKTWAGQEAEGLAQQDLSPEALEEPGAPQRM